MLWRRRNDIQSAIADKQIINSERIYEMGTNLTVAKEILKQLGGNRFITMTGAKNLAAGDNSMSFKIMRNSNKVTHVKIELNIRDTYDITFYNIVGINIKKEYTVHGIYNDQLQDVFTAHTGLDTHL